MRIRFRSFAVLSVVALALFGAGVATAEQAQTARVSNFEVISVDGNNLVVRDQDGTRELTVPDDFRFTVDGKSMSVHELAAGMKGTATITTTTTVRPVYVTEIKKGKVLRQIGRSVIVRDATETQRFTQTEVDARGIEIYMEGKPVKVSQLKAGDEISALIVTYLAPEVLTQQQVDVALAEPEPPPMAAEPAPVEEPPPPPPVEEPAPPMAEPEPAPMPAPVVAAPPPEESNSWLIWVLLIAIVAIGAFLLMRKRPKT